MQDLVWLIPALPLAGFVLLFVFGRRLGDPLAGWLATAMVGGSFAVTVAIWIDQLSMPAEERHHVVTLFSWVPVDALQVDAAFLADPLSITMALFITGVGTLIHLYAIGYMHGDEKFSKFFLYMNLFAFSMLMLVLGENLLVTFLGWEGVGACSYFLISFWHTRESAATAGKKAFVTNRVGDWGFMIAMFLAFQAVGSLSYETINHAAENDLLAKSTATAITMLLFVGACGKSAQLPLYLWLPDAMEGPTPVSALIHAATMVTAGVFLMTRMNPVTAEAFTWAPNVIAIVGAATALFAATIAVAQTDIKRVLAYSTVSQLGYMFLAVGSGAYAAAMFHMITHAFFKALLFLGAGSVIHGMHHQQDMRKMGALRLLMPVTCMTFIVGWLAIAGIPPFAGFWSKDEILLSAWAHPTDQGLFKVLWAVGLVTALLTAFYMTRQVIMVFFGKARWHDAHEEHGAHGDFKPHESPPVMLLPLVVLAAASVLGGALHLPFASSTKFLTNWLEPVVEPGEVRFDVEGVTQVILAVGTAVLCMLAMFAAYLVYQRKRITPFEPAILLDGWHYDRAVSWFMGHPARVAFDDVAWVDANVIDGAVNGAATAVRTSGGRLRRVQSGFVRNYALILGFGVVLLLGWFFLRALGVFGVTESSFPILTALILTPAIGAVVVAFVSRRRPDLVRLIGLLFSGAVAAMSIWLLASFESGVAEMQFTSKHLWIEEWGISWNLGVDGISLFLVVLTGLLWPIALLGASAHHDQRQYMSWLLLLQAGVMGSFLSLDLFLFFVFFEIVLVPMYFLIGRWGYEGRVYAATKFFLFTMAGSAFMLVSLVSTVMIASQRIGHMTFDVTELAEGGGFAVSTGRWLFLGFAVAFAVKVPLFPLHTWLPDAHTQAPTAGSVILAGVLLKLGTYGLLRFGIYLFPEASRWFQPLFLTLAVIGITYGAIVATMQKDLKRLVAYSSVAHLGFIVLGTFAFTRLAMTGGVMQMINHGVSTGALFLLVGMISERRHTREISELSGLQKVAPIFAAVFTLVMLSSIGLPGLNGFVGEFLILIGSFLTARWWVVIAATGVILAALYLLWAYQRVFHGEPSEANKGFKELTGREALVLLPMIAAILFCGIYPKPMLDRIEPSVKSLLTHVQAQTGYEEPQPANVAATPEDGVDADSGSGEGG